MGLCVAAASRGPRHVRRMAWRSRRLGGGAMSNGTHRHSWDTHGARKSVVSLCLTTLCPMYPMSPSSNSAGNVSGQSTHGGAHWKNAYGFLPMVTHRVHRTRLQYQSLRGRSHGTRPRAPRDTAGPYHGGRIGGTRSPIIPVTKVKLERVAYLNSPQFKGKLACR